MKKSHLDAEDISYLHEKYSYQPSSMDAVWDIWSSRALELYTPSQHGE